MTQRTIVHAPLAQCGRQAPESLRRSLLFCGPVASLIYVLTDLAAAARYSGYSLADQAVSELFAIGAPTAPFVTALFSLSSLLLAAFAVGVGLSAGENRALRLASWMFAANALDCLVLWNIFPMHMRADAKTLTDTMHVVLSVNLFVWLAPSFIAFGCKGWMRWTSVAAIAILLVPTIFAFRYVPALNVGADTPGLGFAERAAQYGYQIWEAVLAIELVGRRRFARDFQ